MRLKSYFGASVGAALRQARQDMGDEAVLVEARKASPEARHLGECEVVVALAPTVLPENRSGETSAAAPALTASANAGWLAAEMGQLRREVQRIAATVARSGFTAPTGDRLSAELAEVFSQLVAAEVDAKLAQDVISCLRAEGASWLPGELHQRLRAELSSRFSTDSQLGLTPEPPRVVAVVGPPGAGKTATLVKLAARYGLTGRRPTQLISMDTLRVAAGDQLRSYAAILGLGYQSLDGVGALKQALEEHRHKDLILVDTPGYAPRDMDAASGPAAALAAQPAVDVHLVLTASMKSADLSSAVDRYAMFRPRKLIFTRLDETSSFGPILSQSARTGLPVSFLADGQEIPENLEPATTDRIVDLVLDRSAGT